MQNSSATDLAGDVKLDVEKYPQIDVDNFLRFILSRCLCGPQKDDFERLQCKIETLQATRLNVSSQAPPSGEPQEMTLAQVTSPSDPDEEKSSVALREALLDNILNECLETAVSIANDDHRHIRARLRKFGKLIDDKSREEARYSDYTHMYNAALDQLEPVKVPSLRDPDSSRLRLSRADSKEIEGRFFDRAGDTQRKPVLVRTSQDVALLNHKEDLNELGGSPTAAFKWHQVKSPEEMRAFRCPLSKEAKAAMDHSFTYTAGKPAPCEYDGPWIDNSSSEEPQPDAEMQSSSKKRCSESGENTYRLPKKQHTSAPMTPLRTTSQTSNASKESCTSASQTNSQRNVDARVQVASYAMEMLSYGPGVVHVIATLVIDEYLFIWYYDRQGPMCSTVISIIADFPRFLVLLLAFQRFRLEDWGIVPLLNPMADNCDNQKSLSVDLPRTKGDLFDEAPVVSNDLKGLVCVNFGDYLSAQPHCLSGQMTSVFEAYDSGADTRLACKIYSPEAHQHREGEVIQAARAIASAKDSDMLKHLPTAYFSADIRAENTLCAQSILEAETAGHRTLRIVVTEELAKMTSVNGEAFIQAWFEVVTIHAFLWKYGIEHGDPSLWSIMLRPASATQPQCGVLVDYDLSVIAWLPRILGTDRTGTIPFMALDLLTNQYWSGRTIRYYHHELEALLWIIPYVFLSLDNGKLVLPQQVQAWATSDIDSCRMWKKDFVWSALNDLHHMVRESFTAHAEFMVEICRIIRTETMGRMDKLDEGATPVQLSEALWARFIGGLEKQAAFLDRMKFMEHMPHFGSNKCFWEAEEICKEIIRLPIGLYDPTHVL